MRNVKHWWIIAIVAIIGFTGCPDANNNNNDDNDDNNQPLFSVSGEFRGAGSGNALFKAATTATKARSAISAETSYELSGELEDGDILFRLKGTFDSSSNSYTISSASSFARYTINGDESGSTATLAVNDNGEWKSFIVNVTVKEVAVSEGTAEDYSGGLPSWAQGSWHDWWTLNKDDYKENSFEAWSYFNQWYYDASKSSVYHDNWEFASTKYTVIEAEPVAGQNGVYDVIFSYPYYPANATQKKAALEKFFKDNNHPATFWNKTINPWDTESWQGYTDDGEPTGKDGSTAVFWYVCRNEAHAHYMEPKIIQWDTFVTLLAQENLETDDFFDAVDWEAKDNGYFWDVKASVESFFEEHGIPNFYYWGDKEPGFDWNDDPIDFGTDGATPVNKNGLYSCWEPSCEDGGEGGWWQKTHYYVKEGGNQTGIQGDWDKYRPLFEKWDSDDCLITYLRSQSVQPQTWYTRARLWMDGNDFMFVYYKCAEADESQSEIRQAGRWDTASCDTTSLSKIKSLTFDPEYYHYSFFWNAGRTSPRN